MEYKDEEILKKKKEIEQAEKKSEANKNRVRGTGIYL